MYLPILYGWMSYVLLTLWIIFYVSLVNRNDLNRRNDVTLLSALSLSICLPFQLNRTAMRLHDESINKVDNKRWTLQSSSLHNR